jgi:DNA invertase Pin-like site-specific DNA recombinase
LTSARTKAALEAAKARGVKLGNPKLNADPVMLAEARRKARDARCAPAVDFLRKLCAMGDGVTVRQATSLLNESGIPHRSGLWQVTTVWRIMKREGLLSRERSLKDAG